MWRVAGSSGWSGCDSARRLGPSPLDLLPVQGARSAVRVPPDRSEWSAAVLMAVCAHRHRTTVIVSTGGAPTTDRSRAEDEHDERRDQHRGECGTTESHRRAEGTTSEPRRQGPRLATIASPSSAAHTPSMVPHASGVPSLPIAMPTVRVRIQTPKIARLQRMTAATTARDRRATIASANASWSQATTPKKTPCVHETPACSPIVPKWIPAAPTRARPPPSSAPCRSWWSSVVWVDAVAGPASCRAWSPARRGATSRLRRSASGSPGWPVARILRLAHKPTVRSIARC